MAERIAAKYGYKMEDGAIVCSSPKDAAAMLMLEGFKETGGLWMKDGAYATVSALGWVMISEP